jgi:hypothetical protein
LQVGDTGPVESARRSNSRVLGSPFSGLSGQHYKPVSNPFCPRRGGEYSPLEEVTLNSKEKKSYDFCPNYVQEFGLSTVYIQMRRYQKL